MPEITVAHVDDCESLEEFFDEFERRNPGFKMGFSIIHNGKVELSPEYGGVKYMWILDGNAEIFLPKGYRTQEGDGERLPPIYRAEKLSEDFTQAFQILQKRLNLISEEVPYGGSIRDHAKNILERYQDGEFRGDISGEIAQITPISRGGWCHTQWTEDEAIREAINLLIDKFDEIGWSTKSEDSYEPVGMGDQMVIMPDESMQVKGKIRCLWIKALDKVNPHASTMRRVRYLKDLAGGCNIAFDPFRRLPLTWFVKDITADNPDGYNRVNSHIVNMAEEFSRTHFHPVKAIGGGKPQHELYMVLDPAVYRLSTYGRKSYAYFFPDLEDLAKFEKVDLSPGDLVYIPPGTAHRGVNVLANVLTLPGFKPRNEYYIDKKIKNSTEGKAPYNEYMLSVSSRYDVKI